MGNCLVTRRNGGPNDIKRCGSTMLACPLQLPPQHSSTNAQNESIPTDGDDAQNDQSISTHGNAQNDQSIPTHGNAQNNQLIQTHGNAQNDQLISTLENAQNDQIIPTHGKAQNDQLNPTHENAILFFRHLKVFSYYEIMIATRYFCYDDHVGEGSFACIYKGWLNKQTLRPLIGSGPGITIAVKSLNPTSFQGHKEWMSEITCLTRLDHPNLVNLIGFCFDSQSRALVYEFMPQGSLEDHLFKWSNQPLSWELRVKVAVEAARGLLFLHESKSKITYRVFSSSKILLDMDYNAKLTGYGFAKANPTNDLTHVITQLMESQGYIAPEYIATGIPTTKSDVYSFGIVLLELITGRRAIDDKRRGEKRALLEWVTSQLWEPNRITRIMDINLEGQYSRKEAFAIASLALQCCHPDAKYRPHMSDALSDLEKIPSSRGTRMSTSRSKITKDGPSSSGCHEIHEVGSDEVPLDRKVTIDA